MRILKLLSPVWISLIFTLIFLHNFIFNLGNMIEFSHGDAWHVSFTLKHYFEILESGRWREILNMRMFYGFDKTLLYSEILLSQAILSLPIYFITRNIIFTYNTICALTIFLDFLSMFILARYFTKNTWGSILGAIIFTFNPWTIGHFPDQLMHYSIYAIPMIILFFEKSLEKPTNRNIFLIFPFAVIQLLSNMSYSGLLTIILPIYGGARIWQKSRNYAEGRNAKLRGILNLLRGLGKEGKWGLIGGFVIFILVAGCLGYLYGSFYKEQNVERTSITDTTYFAPWVSDLFFTQENNLLYGGLRFWSIENLPSITFNTIETVERNLFWGFSVIVLFILSFKYLRKTKYRNIWILSMGLAFFSLLLSFGPLIRFSNDFAIPGFYRIFYELHPLVHQLRVSSRFAIFIYLFLGLICAFTLSEILSRQKTKNKWILGLIIVGLVFVEYVNKPWNFEDFRPEVKTVYSKLNEQNDVEVILELPMGNLFTMIRPAGDQFVDSKYMLYAETLHNKKLLNGYSSYSPPEYIKRIEYLSVNFPTAAKLAQLQKWGVDAVIVHKDEYLQPFQADLIKERMKGLNVTVLEETESLSLFRIRDWDLKDLN